MRLLGKPRVSMHCMRVVRTCETMHPLVLNDIDKIRLWVKPMNALSDL
jgi:hypothetical protein